MSQDKLTMEDDRKTNTNTMNDTEFTFDETQFMSRKVKKDKELFRKILFLANPKSDIGIKYLGKIFAMLENIKCEIIQDIRENNKGEGEIYIVDRRMTWRKNINTCYTLFHNAVDEKWCRHPW